MVSSSSFEGKQFALLNMYPKAAQAKSAFLFSSEIPRIYLNKKCHHLIVIRRRELLMGVQVVHKARCGSEANEVLGLLSALLSKGLHSTWRRRFPSASL